MSILYNDVMFFDGQKEDENEAFDLYADTKSSARISELIGEVQETDQEDLWDDQDDFGSMG